MFDLRIIIYCDEIGEMSIREWTNLIAQICFHLLMLPSVLHMFHFLKILVALINSIRSLLLIVKYTCCL